MTEYLKTAKKYSIFEDAKFQIVYAACEQVEIISEAHSQLRHGMRDDSDSGLEDIVRPLSYIRYRLTTNVLPFDDENLGLTALCNELKNTVTSLSPKSLYYSFVTDSIDALGVLLKEGANPFANIIIKILQGFDGKSVVALQYGHHKSRTQDFLDSLGIKVEVVQASQIKQIDAVDELVLVGPARLFDESIWSAPCSNSLHLVQYPQGEATPKTDGLFGADGGLSERKISEDGIRGFSRKIEIYSESEELQDTLSRFVSRHLNQPIVGGEKVEAFLFALQGNFAVWTEVDESNHLLCVEAGWDEQGRVTQKQVLEIVPGDFLLLRPGESNSAYVRNIADTKFGAKQYRERQNEWKTGLKNAVDAAGGISAAEQVLKSHGARVLQLKYWIEKGIGPGDPKDFEFVCQFANLAIDVAARYREIEKIREAHLKAGQFIRNQLEKNLLSSGIEQLMETGYQSYETAELGKIAAFQVKYRKEETVEVSATDLDRPFSLEIK